MRRLVPTGLRARYLVLALLTIVPFVAFVVLTAADRRYATERQVERNLVLSARLAADDVELRLEGVRQVLLTLSLEEEALPGRERSCRAQLRRLLARQRTIVNIGVARADGTIACGGRSGGLPSRLWLERALADHGFALGEFERDRGAGSAVLTAGLPVAGAAGDRLRVVFASLDLAELGRVGREAEVAGATLSVFDTSGTVLARSSRPERFVGREFRDRPLVRAALAEREGITTLEGLDGVRRLYSFSRVSAPGRSPLFVSVGVPEAAAFAAAGRDLRRNLVIVAAVALAALMVALVANNLLVIRPARGLVDTTRRIGAGDLTVRAQPEVPAGELGELARAFDEMAEALEERQGELQRTAEERRNLLTRLSAGEEEFRRRVAADIHDDSAQALSAVGLRLDALADSSAGLDQELLVEARTSIRLATERLRRLLFELRPPVLDEAGLAAAIDSYLAGSADQDGLSYRVDDRSKREPRSDTRAILYRIALEALANVRKHARAERVEVSISRDDGGVLLRVEDDGTGFASDGNGWDTAGHLGLVTMEERARAAGGWWRVETSPESGTVVECWLPDGVA